MVLRKSLSAGYFSLTIVKSRFYNITNTIIWAGLSCKSIKIQTKNETCCVIKCGNNFIFILAYCLVDLQLNFDFIESHILNDD